VESVRSTTTRGSSEIDVTFNDGANALTSFQAQLNAALGEERACRRTPSSTTGC
jgi:hypothetical protein